VGHWDFVLELVREHVRRHGGREVKTLEGGLLTTFDGPGAAIRCACAIVRDGVAAGADVRHGIHTGECSPGPDDLTGVAVDIGAPMAAAGEVLVSRTVVDLVAGSGIAFEDRGVHDLEGVPGRWQLFADSDQGALPPCDRRSAGQRGLGGRGPRRERDGELGARADVELLEGVGEVRLDGALRHV